MLQNVLCVLQRARVKPFTTKSDFARMAANEVALCASDGLITTRLDDNIVSNVWVVTQDGMVALEELTDAFN
jgi:phage-related protein